MRLFSSSWNTHKKDIIVRDASIGRCPGSQEKVRKSEKPAKIVSEKSGSFRKKEESQEKSGNLDRLSKRKRSTVLNVQSDDLSFFQNVISRSQGKIREDESRKNYHSERVTRDLFAFSFQQYAMFVSDRFYFV